MNNSDQKCVSIVIPVLNEIELLSDLMQALDKALEGLSEEIEILFIDDGSTDGSSAWLLEKSEQCEQVRTARLSRNFGHQSAITAGLDLARGDAVIVMDADLQDPPDLIPELLQRWREGFEVVFAVRKKREGDPLLKRFLAACFYKTFSSVSSIQVPPDAGDFRLLDRKVVEALRSMRETHRYVRAMTSWIGYKQTAVEYDRKPRFKGQTKYPLWKSVRLAWDGLTSFSGAPLRWFSGLGVVACVTGFLWIISIVIGKILYPSELVAGWASTMAAILFMGGIQLLSLGVLGQYLSRTFEESKKRPLYLIDYDSGDI